MPTASRPPATFALVAALFALFAAPLFLVVTERVRAGSRFSAGDAARSWAQLGATIRHAQESPGLLRFIVARFFYSDPVNTAIAVMSAFAVFAVGFTEAQALQVLLILTVVAVIASFGWGFLADRWGPRRTLFAVLGTWAIGLVILTLFLSTVPFLIAGALLGAGLGGVGVVDRLMLLRLAPPERIGEMFGLYGLVGKFSAVFGPIVYGAIVATLLDRLDTRGVPGRDRVAVRLADRRPGHPPRRPGRRAGQRGRRRRGARGGHGRVTIIVAHRGASRDGAREHDGGLPAGRRGGGRRDRA